ncbi:MAG: gamma-glutamyltransferase family protein [Thermomicrobiales bacterium]|nr:gamma-glutamyltransferase family protein [Thermomicrobiales bacterium]
MTIGVPRDASIPTPYARRRRGAPVFATGGMVASAHPLVTSTALRVLASGGNAVDAAIGGALTAAVVLPAMCGLGGDLFAIVAPPMQEGGRREAIDSILSSGISSRTASLAFMQERAVDGGRAMPQNGPLSPAVPGFVAGIAALHQRFASRPLAELAVPAIRYAADGFVISPMVGRWLIDQESLLAQYPASAAVFLPHGRAPKVGEVLRQPDLAGTLGAVAAGGAETFYRGPIARKMAAFLAADGGVLTAEDFADHEAVAAPPIATTYRDYTIYQTGLPTQGFVHLEAHNIVEGDDLRGMGVESASGIHLMAEALKLAFADRLAFAGDPILVDCPLEVLLSKAWAAERRATIAMDRVRLDVTPGALRDGDTTYLCAIDDRGMMVSLIVSLSAAFGSGIVAGDTGVLLNNRAGHGFSLDPAHPNVYAPGKRTMHTLNCFLLGDRNGLPLLAGGTPGGDGQPQWNLQLLTGLIDADLDVQAAVEQPRWSIWPATYPIEVGNPVELRIEGQVDDETIERLRARGHTVRVEPPWSAISHGQLIARDPETGALAGGSDPRAEGLALGL